jgi:molybdopterin synthase sulfur carrier subunit
MSVSVKLPLPLRGYAEQQRAVPVEGATVGEALTSLTTRYPALKPHLYTDSGELRNFVNLFVNGENVRRLQGEQTPVKPSDEIQIVPAVAGG